MIQVLKKGSIVCPVTEDDPYKICALSGMDLSRATGILMADMPDNFFGWMQTRGGGLVAVSGQTRTAYVDFRPNNAKFDVPEPPPGSMLGGKVSDQRQTETENINRQKDPEDASSH